MKKPNFYDNIEKVSKTRAEQEEEFRTYIAPWAKLGCMSCLGRGWKHYHVQLEQLVVCDCVLENLKKEWIKGEPTEESEGFLSKFRDIFGMGAVN